MTFHIRAVSPSDIPAITAIYAQAVLHGTASFELEPPSIAEMTNRIQTLTNAGFPYVVAIDDKSDALLGYAYAGPFRSRPAYQWTVENSVYIDPTEQGRGLGQALTMHIIDQCTKRGHRQMIAVIGGSKHFASIKMHEKCGFTHIGTLPATGFKHNQWLDSVLMQITLGDGAQTPPKPLNNQLRAD